MRPRIDTTDAMTFLNWLAPGGSFVLVSCKGHDPIEARLCNAAEAPRFLANHTRRGRIVRVLLGEPAPGFHCSRTVPKIERAHYVSLATSIARFKELDAAAKPSIWITAQDHAIAAWRLSLPATGDETFTAISAFGLEFGGKILPDMIPVPDLGNGFERHSFRFDRDAIVWKGKIQFARAAAPKKTAASEGDRLAQALSDFNTHFVIGQSSTHSISHTKGAVLDGKVAFEGSTNWSTDGEGTFLAGKTAPGGPGYKAQNNTLSVIVDPRIAARFQAELINEHTIAQKQASARAAA